MKTPIHPPNIARIIEAFEKIPHCRALGMTVMELHDGHGLMYVPFHDRLIGNPKTGAFHGGVITALLDTLGAMVVMASIPEHTSVATLDLRIDYLRPGTPGQTLFASAECYRVTTSVAFVRGFSYQETFREPIAHGTATYRLGGSGFGTQTALQEKI
jgi:uncharacterized protein (TIGR00369 family)